jgi:hypothetical protein
MNTFLGGISGYNTKDDFEKFRVVRVDKKTGKEKNIFRNLTLDEALFLADKRTRETAKAYIVVIKDKTKR